MKKIIVNGFKFLGMHIFMVFMSFILSTILGYVGGIVTFSVIMSIIYVGAMVGMGNDYGHSDLSAFDVEKPSLIRPLLSSLIPVAVGLLFVVAIVFTKSAFLIKGWFVMFIGFFKSAEYATFTELLFMFLSLPVSVSVGYWFGMKNISFFDNMDSRMKAKAKEKQEKQEREHQRRVELERKKRM